MPDTPAQPHGQDQSGTTPGAAAPVASPAPAQAAPAQGVHPWDNDLGFIPDPQVRSQVSEYLAQTWQPRMTQLEQDSAAGLSLLNDFRSAPRDTLREVVTELIEDGHITQEEAIAYFQGEQPEAVQPEAQPPAQATAPEQTGRDPEVQALLDRERERAEREAYEAEFERVKAAHPDLALDPNLYLQAVAETGDFDQAVEYYQDNFGEFDAYLRSQGQADATEPAPPPVADSGAGTAEVPTEPKYATLDDAIDDYFAEQNAAGQRPSAAVPSAPAPPVATG